MTVATDTFDDVHVDADLDIELKRNQPDPLAICTACLVPILETYLARWRRQHPAETGRDAGDSYIEGRLAAGARADVAMLAQHSGVSATIIAGILRHHDPTVTLRQADKLLCATGDNHLLNDGEQLEPFRRPTWKWEFEKPDAGQHACPR
jgi:hypothetical protein